MDTITPSSIGTAMSNFFGGAAMTNQIILYTQYIVLALVMGIILFGLYLFAMYKYKVYTPKLVYSSDKHTAKIYGWKKDYARNIKIAGVQKQRLLFSRKNIEPFRVEDIQPGNKVYAFLVNDDGTYISFPNIDLQEGAKFQRVTTEESFWAIMQLKENANNFIDQDLAKRQMIYTLITIGICCAMVIFTVWYCLQAPQKIAGSVDKLAPVMERFIDNIGIRPPA